MSEPNPLNFDAVLGGNNPQPVNAAILGGWTGLQRKLEANLHLPIEICSFETCQLNNAGQIIDREPKENLYYTEDLGDRVLIEMMYIPGGEFLMGSPAGAGDDTERPQHRVKIAPFYMGKYPITEAQYRSVIGQKIIRPKGNNYPIESIPWAFANRFCDRLSQLTGKIYTLPTESQWEYACRARTETNFYFGNILTPSVANYWVTEKNIGQLRLTEVGSFPPNQFGLFDLHGSVAEWCLDNWRDNYQTALIAPTDLYSNNLRIARILRGGCYYLNDFACRSASRRNSLSQREAIGFRIVSPLLL